MPNGYDRLKTLLDSTQDEDEEVDVVLEELKKKEQPAG